MALFETLLKATTGLLPKVASYLTKDEEEKTQTSSSSTSLLQKVQESLANQQPEEESNLLQKVMQKFEEDKATTQSIADKYQQWLQAETVPEEGTFTRAIYDITKRAEELPEIKSFADTAEAIEGAAMIPSYMALGTVILPTLSTLDIFRPDKVHEINIPYFGNTLTFEGFRTAYEKKREIGQQFYDQLLQGGYSREEAVEILKEEGLDPNSAYWGAAFQGVLDLSILVSWSKLVARTSFTKFSPQSLIKEIDSVRVDRSKIRNFISGADAESPTIPKFAKDMIRKTLENGTREEKLAILGGDLKVVTKVKPSRLGEILGITQEKAESLIRQALGLEQIAPKGTLQLPGYAPIGGKPQPKVGLSMQPVERVGGELPRRSTSLSTTRQSLLQEARKYKSAEEFVKKSELQKVYHGSRVSDVIEKEGFKIMPDRSAGAYGDGIYLSTKKNDASGYTVKGGVVEAYLPKNIKLFEARSTEPFTVNTKKLIAEGYDGVKTKLPSGAENITIFDPSIIKTKSQLTDIWKQANGVSSSATESTATIASKIGTVERETFVEFIDSVRVKGRVPEELEVKARALADDIGVNIDQNNSKLADELTDLLDIQRNENRLLLETAKNTAPDSAVAKSQVSPTRQVSSTQEAGLNTKTGQSSETSGYSSEIDSSLSTEARLDPEVNPPTAESLKKRLETIEPGRIENPEILPRYKQLTPERHIPESLSKELSEFVASVETPIEFIVGKSDMQATKIKYGVREVANRLNKAKNLTEQDYKDLFNAIDDPKKYDLTPRLEEALGSDFRQLHKQTMEFLTAEQVDMDLLHSVFDDSQYLQTVLETLEGTQPTARQLAELKLRGGATFRDLMVVQEKIPGARFSTKNPKDVERKFATADLRDKYLRQFDLRTKRDYAISFASKVNLVKRLTGNAVMKEYLRAASKKGLNMQEAYDPIELTRFREELINKSREMRADIVGEMRKNRLLTEEAYSELKTEAKDYFQNLPKVTNLDESRTVTQNLIDDYFADLRQSLKTVKGELTETQKIKIDEAKAKIETQLQEKYGEIALRRADIIDQGFKDAEGINPEFRGIMLQDRDYRALKELSNDLSPTGLGASLEDAARSFKYIQATLDLFQLPQALRSEIRTIGFMRGVGQWLEGVTTIANRKIAVKDIIESAEFIQQGRHVDFDVDTWKKFSTSFSESQSEFANFIDKLGDKTDVSILRGAKEAIQGFVEGLEKYQWETVMVPLKVRAWKTKVSQLKKSFPNMSERQIKIEAGRAVDDYFQGQNWNKLMARNPRLASKRTQRALRISIFATDYLTSSLRSAKRDFLDIFKPGVKGNIGRKSALRVAIIGLGLTQLISYKLNGHSTFENDDPKSWFKIQLPWKDEQGNPYYLDLMGNWGQAYTLIDRPREYLSGKVGGLGRVGLSVGSSYGLDFSGFNVLPFNLRGMASRLWRDLTDAPGEEFGVPENVETAIKIQLLEFFGVSGTFSGGKSKTSTLRKVVQNIFDGENMDTVIDNTVNWILGRAIKTEKAVYQKLIDDGKWDEVKDRIDAGSVKSAQLELRSHLGIEGSIEDDENIAKLKGEAGNILLSTYSERTSERIERKLGNSQRTGSLNLNTSIDIPKLDLGLEKIDLGLEKVDLGLSNINLGL